MASKQQRNFWKSQGLCANCGNEKSREGRTLCGVCADKFKTYHAHQYAKRKSEGSCLSCGKQADGEALCSACRTKRDARYEARKEAGVCSACSKPTDGKTICGECHKSNVEAARERRSHYRSLGLCVKCGRDKPKDGRTRCAECREASKPREAKRRRRWRECNLCNRCGKAEITRGLSCDACYDKTGDAYLRLKLKVLDGYGGACVCCGDDFIWRLTVDHVDGDGKKHRAEVGVGAPFYRWIIKNNFPSNLQVLCFSCNSCKYLNVICPH